MIDEDDIPTGEIVLDEEELDEDGNPIERGIGLDWLMRFRDMVDDLNRRDVFEVEQFDFYDPVTRFVEETMEHGLGLNLPREIKSFYRTTDGLELRWSYTEDGETHPGGAIHLFGYAEVFGNWLDTLWGNAPDDASEEDVDFTWELRAIELANDEADAERFTVMHVPEMLPAFNLFLHDPTGATHRLEVDFVDYVECLVETRGVPGWQYLVSDVDFQENEEALQAAEHFYEIMEKFFPSTDLSRFRKP